MPVDRRQQPPHEIWRDCARDGAHRPVGNGGNGGSQVMLDVASIAHVMQKRSQCGCQKLRTLQMQPWRDALDESNDIAGT